MKKTLITWKRWRKGAYYGNVDTRHLFRIFREKLSYGNWWLHDMRTQRKDGKAQAYASKTLREAKEFAQEIL